MAAIATEKGYGLRTSSIVVGCLFLCATLFFIAGQELTSAAFRTSDLNSVRNQKQQVVFGALLILADGFAVVFIALLLFPLLSRQNSVMALGYVALRLTEMTAVMLYALIPLCMLSIAAVSNNSKEEVSSTALTTLAEVLGSLRQSGLIMVYLSSGCAGLTVSAVLWTSQLVPRWLSAFGLVGYTVFTLGSALDLFGVVDINGTSGAYFLALGGLWEVVAPLWLCFKGFDKSAAAALGLVSREPGEEGEEAGRSEQELLHGM
uniref:DUF4386 domain-containing protein n=1 Tax=Chromera velia CCMP2878 TaxID=1169474 RepID=A0A0G4HKH8_9ALVE|eukprot:Cvel_7201.t1-p1 / transcript=Cvel_7201.t1 / gene=Cvel_7201 / organism=Chromera_velia_CCMP2878 / gene_product=hypothetical protein / transcript_product=hypothetical protein / location=Cvel_scaffold371:8429-9211(-) / protein_length=261 / sequence_SO=supercontig / SO=protein_coding / is_pseudo=false